MNTLVGICGIALLGWAPPEYAELAPTPGELLQTTYSYSQQVHPLGAAARPAQSPNTSARRRPRMPLAPTDPRAFVGEDMPLPPTVNDDGITPSAQRAGPEPRFIPAGLVENRSGRLTNPKPFTQYSSGPAVSPYTLLNAGTNDGTVSTYMSYVRPAQEQERATQEMDQALSAEDNRPAATYPRVFQNTGTYFPDYSVGR